MSETRTEGIVLAVRPHGEAGAIVRLLTPTEGLVGAYVRGGRSRRHRPMLQPGNALAVTLRQRTPDQLAGATVELVRSVAPLHAEPLAAAGLSWVTTLTAAALPERQHYPGLYAALAGLIDAIAAAGRARDWAAGIARYEQLLLVLLGFGLPLGACAATGATQELVWVSRRTGAAVSRTAARGHEDRLLPLPAFLRIGGAASDMDEALAGLAVTGLFVERWLLDGRARDTLAARQRLVDRLSAAG